jgi:AcrR family transcriptional regulator
MAKQPRGGTVSRPASVRVDKQRNRARIIAAADALIAERGADISFEEIARRAGVGSATMHRHFGSRAELLEVVFRDRAEVFALRAEALAGQGSTGWALATWLRELHTWVTQSAGASRSLAVSAEEAAEAQYSHTSCRDLIGVAGQRLLIGAQQDGVAPPAVTMDEIITLILGIAMSAEADMCGPADPADLVELVIRSVAFGGIEPPPR